MAIPHIRKLNTEYYPAGKLFFWKPKEPEKAHPFADYNGRLARMFTSYILMRLHLPIIEIEVKTEATRRRYITSLQEADQGNYQNLNSLLTQALNESLHTIQTKF